MKNVFPFLLALTLALVASISSFSQTITPNDRKKLTVKEDSLKLYAQFMITDSMTADRMVSDSIFTKILVRALRIRNSFYHPMILFLTMKCWHR